MPPAVIENPILNSPFEEPTRHFHFDDDGISNTITEGRRRSAYFVPSAAPKKKGKQLAFQDLAADRLQDNDFVSRLRQRVSMWRRGGYLGVTATTARLLEYWTNPERERKLSFCQIEALEKVIYLTEVAHKFGDGWIADELKRALKAEVDESAWASLYSTASYPFERPETGKIAVKVINHYGDEVLKVYEV